MNEGTTTDHNSFFRGKPMDKDKVVFSSPNGNIEDIVMNGQQITMRKGGSGVAINDIDTNEDQTISKLPHKVILDNDVMPDVIPNGTRVYFERPAYIAEVGLDVKIAITTLPISVPIKTGQTVASMKRVIQAQLMLKDSLGVYVNQKLGPDRHFNIVLDNHIKPFTGVKLVDLLGYTRLNQIEITQKNPLPLELLGIGYKVQIN